MALLLIAMFLVASLSSTSSPSDKKTLRNGQAVKQNANAPQQNYNKPALHEFDMDQVGWVRPSDDDAVSKSSGDEGGNKKKGNNNENDKARNDVKKSGDKDVSSTSLSDSRSSFDGYDMDLYEFARDADLLDAQAALDEAAEEFYRAMQEELLTKQSDIDEAITATMKTIQTDVKEMNNKQQKKFGDNELNKLTKSVEDDLRNAVSTKIETMTSEMLDDTNTDMEAAVDIDEQYEEEGSGDPIDLEAEQEELTMEVINLTDEIVDEVLTTELSEMAFSSFNSVLKKSLQENFKDRKFAVDVDKNNWKVKGWRDITPTPKPTPQPTPQPTPSPTTAPKTEDDEEAKDESKGEDEPKEEENKVEQEKEEAGETEGK